MDIRNAISPGCLFTFLKCSLRYSETPQVLVPKDIYVPTDAPSVYVLFMSMRLLIRY